MGPRNLPETRVCIFISSVRLWYLEVEGVVGLHGTTSSVRIYDVCNHVRRSMCDVRGTAKRLAVSGRRASVILSYPTITSWSVVPREKLIVPQLVCRLPAFHAARTFTTQCLQQLVTCCCPELDSSSPRPPACFKSILVLSTHIHRGIPSGQVYSATACTHCSPPLTCHTPPPLFDHSYNVG